VRPSRLELAQDRFGDFVVHRPESAARQRLLEIGDPAR